jgi:hypothetical protein
MDGYLLKHRPRRGLVPQVMACRPGAAYGGLHLPSHASHAQHQFSVIKPRYGVITDLRICNYVEPFQTGTVYTNESARQGQSPSGHPFGAQIGTHQRAETC